VKATGGATGLIIPWVLVAILVLLIVAFVWWRWRRRRKQQALLRTALLETPAKEVQRA
jgi:Flp pilus assembly protein TadB